MKLGIEGKRWIRAITRAIAAFNWRLIMVGGSNL